VGFVVDNKALGGEFEFTTEHFCFSLQPFIPPTASTLPSTIQGWYNRPIRGLSISGIASTPAQQKYKESFVHRRLEVFKAVTMKNVVL
jgi:hypothetical protein